MRIKFVFLLILAWVTMCAPAYSSVTATLDKNQTSLGNPVQLTIVSDQKQAIEDLDTTALEQDFNIVGRSSSSDISMSNGVVSIKEHVFFILMAKRIGQLTIPALNFGNQQTAPLNLIVTVADTKSPPSEQDGITPPVIIETLWENPGKAYVQSQLNLIIRIYHQGNLLEAALDEPLPADTLVRRIGDNLRGTSSKDGIQYQIIEQRYALFPQKSGTLTVPPITMQARVPDSRRQSAPRFGFDPFSRGKQLTLQSKALSIQITPPSPDFTGQAWLPSDAVMLSRSGLPDQPINLGDAINMRIDFSALGLTGAQLPEIQITGLNKQFKLYPDQPAFADSTSDGKIIKGSRTQTFVLIASETGSLEIPKIDVLWWDRQKHSQQSASLPAASIEVIPPEAGAEPLTDNMVAAGNQQAQTEAGHTESPNDEAVQNNVNSVWMWISLASLCGWLLTIVYFLSRHTSGSRPPPSVMDDRIKPDLRPLLKKISTAASLNQAENTWQALQAYSRTRWPNNSPKTPEDWARQLKHSECGRVVAELDTHLFRNQQRTDWEGGDICRVLLPKLDQSRTKAKNRTKQAVPKMYPSD